MAPEPPKAKATSLKGRAVGMAAALVAGLALFLVFTFGPDGSEESVNLAEDWARDEYYPPSTVNTSDSLAGTPTDKRQLDELVVRLQDSAEKGDTAAMTRLGVMHKYGVGILQNYDLAAKWIQQSAYSADPDGMLELGRLYRDGVGVEKDPILAYVWFNRAAAGMNMRAVKERDAILRGLTSDQLKAAQELSTTDSSEIMADSISPEQLKATARP